MNAKYSKLINIGLVILGMSLIILGTMSKGAINRLEDMIIEQPTHTINRHHNIDTEQEMQQEITSLHGPIKLKLITYNSKE